MLGSQGSEQSRVRIGLAFLIAGLLLLAWAWGSWIFRTEKTSAVDAVAVQPQVDAAEQRAATLKAIPLVILAGVILLLVFFLGTLALRRWAKQMREDVDLAKGKPTPADDVWSMHRPPASDDPDLD